MIAIVSFCSLSDYYVDIDETHVKSNLIIEVVSRTQARNTHTHTTRTHTHTQTHTNKHTHTCARKLTHTRIRTYTNTHLHIHTRIRRWLWSRTAQVSLSIALSISLSISLLPYPYDDLFPWLAQWAISETSERPSRTQLITQLDRSVDGCHRAVSLPGRHPHWQRYTRTHTHTHTLSTTTHTHSRTPSRNAPAIHGLFFTNDRFWTCLAVSVSCVSVYTVSLDLSVVCQHAMPRRYVAAPSFLPLLHVLVLRRLLRLLLLHIPLLRLRLLRLLVSIL